jgi:hypothetical protein
MTASTIKKNSARVDNLRYCPKWTVGKKKGRPKKDKQTMGITDHIQNSGGERKRGQKGTTRAGGESEIETILEAEDAIDIDDLLQPGEGKPDVKGNVMGTAD